MSFHQIFQAFPPETTRILQSPTPHAMLARSDSQSHNPISLDHVSHFSNLQLDLVVASIIMRLSQRLTLVLR